MARFTTKLALYKPGGGASGIILPDEAADIDKINSNMDSIDAALGFPICTSTTRPASPFIGQGIFETDTQRIRFWNGTTWVATNAERGNAALFTAADVTVMNLLVSPNVIAGDLCNLQTTNQIYRFTGTVWQITTPTCHLLTTAAGATSATAGVFTAVPYNSELFDALNMHDNATNNSRITVPYAGVYRATHKIQTTSTGFDSAVGIMVNGVVLVESLVYATRNSTNGAFPMVSMLVKLNAGDYVEGAVTGTAGGLSLGSGNCFFEVQFVSS